MKTVHKILIAVLSVAFVISAAALGLSFFADKGDIDILPEAVKKAESVDNICSQSLTTDYPLIQSDFEKILYSVKPDGAVVFYQIGTDVLSEYAGEVKTIELTPSCTYYKIPITVYYIEVDGRTLGYGLFTTENSDAKVNLYSYAFAKLIDAPMVYGVDGKLLLLSTDPEEAYSTDKTYTEAFEVNMENKRCKSFTAQRDRTADRNGRLAQRWSILTDGYLSSASKKACMISGRLYDEGTSVYDVYDLNKGLNKPVVKGIYSQYLKEDSDSGLVYLKKTDNGFKSVRYIAEEKTIAQFTGDMVCDFVFSGDWVYDLKNKEFTNLVTGKTVDGKNLDDTIPTFCVNDDGSKIVVMMSGEDTQKLSIVSADGEVKRYSSDNIYSADIQNMCFIENSTVLTTAVKSDGTCVNYIITAQ